MGRCGCSSAAASGAAIANTTCVVATGAGTPSSPFEITPVVDPSAANLLDCGPSGLLVPDPDNPGNWSPYTPAWSSSGTPQPSAVPGYLLGSYRRRGKSVELSIQLDIPNGTGLGSGYYTLSYPSGLIPAFVTALAAVVGVANANTTFPGVGILTPSGIVISVATADGPVIVGEPAPGGFGWGPGSYIAISGVYRAL